VVSVHAVALRRFLAEVGVWLWGVGIVLYLVLVVIILLRLMVVEVTPEEMGPAYWIAMGATAISVRAAGGILDLPSHLAGFPVLELHPFAIGTSVVLCAFGTWWIPLLVLFGLWRHVVRGYPLAYEPRLWSMVFPLGMYTVASYTLGQAVHLELLVSDRPGVGLGGRGRLGGRSGPDGGGGRRGRAPPSRSFMGASMPGSPPRLRDALRRGSGALGGPADHDPAASPAWVLRHQLLEAETT
jgi:hypothetical protein